MCCSIAVESAILVKANRALTWSRSSAIGSQANILVPSESLQTMIDGLPRPFRGEWPEEHVASIARRFSFSEEVVLRRLLTLGVTTPAYYRRMREHYLERFLRARAAERIEAEGFLEGSRCHRRNYSGERESPQHPLRSRWRHLSLLLTG